MRHSVVLIISTDNVWREHWSRVVRSAGHWPLQAALLDQARAYIHKVRPNLVLTEAQVGTDRGLWLLDELQAIPALQSVPVVVVGPLTQLEMQTRNPAVHPRPDGLDDTTLLHLLEELLIP